jgi:hypothetical protein
LPCAASGSVISSWSILSSEAFSGCNAIGIVSYNFFGRLYDLRSNRLLVHMLAHRLEYEDQA